MTTQHKRKKPPKSRFALIEKKSSSGKVVEFPQMKGRTVEKLELFTSADDHSVAIQFQDRTLLSLRFELGFTVSADYLDFKTGDGRVIKRWRPIRSEG